MKFEIILSVFLFLLLCGCASRAVPNACQSVSQGALANCVYVNSVLEQNPYYCYSIENLEQRKTCMQDASSPTMRTALQRASPEEQKSIFISAQPPPQDYSQSPPSRPPAAPQQGCGAKAGAERDACFKAEAISTLKISTCDQIPTASARQSCISDVARKTKDIESCSALKSSEDANLCKFYAKGEEAKS